MLNNNKRLFLILIALVAILTILQLMRSEKTVRSFKAELFTLDTAAVASFSLFPPAHGGEEIAFTKSANAWTVSSGDVESGIDAANVQAMLGQIMEVKPQRLAGRDQDKWKQFQVDDSAGTRLLVKDAAGNALVDLMVGKTSFRQARGQQRPGQQPQITGLSYVRNFDEEETYATEGFLGMAFNRDFNAFRDKSFLAVNTNNLRSITMNSPAGNLNYIKSPEGWMLNGAPVDSAQIDSWLLSMASLQGEAIDDGFSPAGSADYQATLVGDNMDNVELQAYSTGSDFRIHSSLNMGIWFVSDSAGIWSKTFGNIVVD
ncbi:MAG: DUF4340 domain-containing protein [Bacteroidia bacterium]